jgi:anti-anti-sigma regulatory factor
MGQSFKIDIFKDHRGDNVELIGNITSETDRHFEELLQKISSNRVVMDFSKTGRINSMGIAILLRTIKSIKTDKKAEISIMGLNQINTLLFKMTGIFLLASEAGSN